MAAYGMEHVAPTRILIVDDHPVVRFGLKGLLATRPGYEVVGEAETCAQACAALQELEPDVVILDLELDDASGTDALSALHACCESVRIIVYTAHDTDWLVVDSVRAGVQGYLVKDTPANNIFNAVDVVARGGSYLDPSVTHKVMGQVGGNGSRKGARADTLSMRERTVLKLIAEGKRNKEISKLLFISEATVKFHVSAMLSKLHATNRTEAVKNAAAQGLIRLQ